MDIKKYLIHAGVEEEFHTAAQNAINLAKKRNKGSTWAKWKVRLFKTGKISKLIPWEAERLIDVRPDLADWDVAPMINITSHGDNMPWEMTPHGGRPVPNVWLNKDPASEEYKSAVQANYWGKGEHPRSKKSVKAWYHRNAGEYLAWKNGISVDLTNGVKTWHNADSKLHTTIYNIDDAWEVLVKKKIFGKLCVDIRIGFEIDNIFNIGTKVQTWFPINGHDLRAPAVWSSVPTFTTL